MDEFILQKAGLSINEIKTYKALLETGSCTAGRITDKSRIHRRACYDSLSRLIEKGLVSFIVKNSIKHYQAANPERIITYIEEKELELERTKGEVRKIIPELNKAIKNAESELDAEIFIGKEGSKTITDNILRQRKEWLSIGSTGKGQAIMPYYMKHFGEKRIKIGIKRKVIIADTKESHELIKELKKQGLAEIRYLPKKIKQVSTIWVYGEYVVIIMVSTEKPLFFQIKNKEIAGSFKEYFEWLWNIAKA